MQGLPFEALMRASFGLGWRHNLYRNIFQLALDSLDVNTHLTFSYFLNVCYIRMLFSFENGVNLFERLAFGLDPINSLE